ncbi:bifunctional metallophosphatase/5'-nucleotidase [Corallococcus llansteffanensis]|uniref:Bifunctional metallophosphatase/5'-nucleotidase n=1 Tax=Corallococcus llansteffanensis TaxID=2316731 RepID=A0A3A8QKJ1_9BACT|nr:bifunctional UDP-sugar hydrolase/5'-nucleotidase [Corallococcus llansteffanensis]RKH68291.1 bifunctional metallophosphatase/5'-nucleotidase [Corallococcus llansteffanensis]
MMNLLRLRLRWTLAATIWFPLFLSGISWGNPGLGATTTGDATSAATEPLVSITLLHVNDVYHLAPVDQGRRGGLARVATLCKQVKAESPHVLILLGGDTLSPSAESVTTQGRHMVDAWNELGLDYAVLGNHEFDFGPEVLRQRMRESRFTWLGANVVDRKTGKLFDDALRPFAIRDMGGVKVGVLGLVLPGTAGFPKAGSGLEFQEVCATAKRLVPKMRAEGAQVIVALTHLTMQEDKALARCAPIDLILGGHEHSLLMAASQGTPILKMTADARELGRITLQVGARSGKLGSIDWAVLPVTDAVKGDEAFTRKLRERHGELLTRLDQRVGETKESLQAGTAANRTRETNLGSFLADAYREVTAADVALVNGGFIRADEVFFPGPLTERDLLSIAPFQEQVAVVQVRGAVLLQALENGVSLSAEDEEPGRFPQVSGLRFAFDVCQPAGHRVVDVTVGGKPLRPEATYTLATNESLAAHGIDGYGMLKGTPALTLPGGRKLPAARELLRQSFAAPGGIAPKVDGRIERRKAGQREDQVRIPPVCPANEGRVVSPGERDKHAP